MPAEYLRRIRWPTDYHSNYGFDTAPKSNNDSSLKSFIRFPNFKSKFQNESPLPANENNKVTAAPVPTSNDALFNEINSLATTMPLPPASTPNTVNNELYANANDFILNKAAIENGFEPVIYVENGIFKVKYLPKSEFVSTEAATDSRSTVLASSINETEETAIILNDKQHPIAIDNVQVTAAPTTANDHKINNTEIPFQWNETATKDTSFNPNEDEEANQPQTPQNQSNNKKPTLFNGLPIIV